MSVYCTCINLSLTLITVSALSEEEVEADKELRAQVRQLIILAKILVSINVSLLKIRLDTMNAELWKSVIDSSTPGVPIKSQQVNGHFYVHTRFIHLQNSLTLTLNECFAYFILCRHALRS